MSGCVEKNKCIDQTQKNRMELTTDYIKGTFRYYTKTIVNFVINKNPWHKCLIEHYNRVNRAVKSNNRLIYLSLFSVIGLLIQI